MVPYIDSMDGPVVKAAETALDMENIKYILPYVSSEDEDELKDAFEKTLLVRELSGDAAELADYWFFETAVRLNRKEEEKSYTGLKSAGIGTLNTITQDHPGLTGAVAGGMLATGLALRNKFKKNK